MSVVVLFLYVFTKIRSIRNKVVKEEPTKAQTVKNWFTALKKHSDRIPDYLVIPSLESE